MYVPLHHSVYLPFLCPWFENGVIFMTVQYMCQWHFSHLTTSLSMSLDQKMRHADWSFSITFSSYSFLSFGSPVPSFSPSPLCFCLFFSLLFSSFLCFLPSRGHLFSYFAFEGHLFIKVEITPIRQRHSIFSPFPSLKHMKKDYDVYVLAKILIPFTPISVLLTNRFGWCNNYVHAPVDCLSY